MADKPFLRDKYILVRQDKKLQHDKVEARISDLNSKQQRDLALALFYTSYEQRENTIKRFLARVMVGDMKEKGFAIPDPLLTLSRGYIYGDKK